MKIRSMKDLKMYISKTLYLERLKLKEWSTIYKSKRKLKRGLKRRPEMRLKRKPKLLNFSEVFVIRDVLVQVVTKDCL